MGDIVGGGGGVWIGEQGNLQSDGIPLTPEIAERILNSIISPIANLDTPTGLEEPPEYFPPPTA